MFSAFTDPGGYAGAVPSAKFLQRVYVDYGSTIDAHLAQCVQQRGAETLSWDASYKIPRYLAHDDGEKTFHGLITGGVNDVC